MGFLSGIKDMFKGSGSGLISGALGVAGGILRSKSRDSAQAREYERQKEFAQNGIRWRVEDAKQAGIHPLYAIGANTPTYSPQSAVGTDYGLSQAGQDISRAIEAKQTRAERAHAQEVSDAISGAQVGLLQAQTRYYDSQADAIGQRAVDNALDYASSLVANSQQATRTQSTQRQPSLPSEISTYGDAQPGIIPYRVGDTYFEFPPSDVADVLEDPKMMAAWKAAVEGAYFIDGKIPEHFKKVVSPEHKKGLSDGTLKIIRLPGIGIRIVPNTKENPQNVAKKVMFGSIRSIYGG